MLLIIFTLKAWNQTSRGNATKFIQFYLDSNNT